MFTGKSSGETPSAAASATEAIWAWVKRLPGLKPWANNQSPLKRASPSHADIVGRGLVPRRGGGRGVGRTMASLLLLALVAVLAASCVNTPGYLIDIYPEMHYSPSYRPQEPPRLSAPADAVPITGKEVLYTLDEARLLENPLPAESANRGAQVYDLNCSICHGPTGRGNGAMADRFVQAGATQPVDYTSQRVRGRTDGELFFYVTNGIGFMPPFGKLLSPEDRWSAIRFIHLLQG